MLEEKVTSKRFSFQSITLNVPLAVIDFLQSIAIAISVCIVIYVFFATPNQIEGDSMQPNFYDSEIILTNKVSEWLGGTQFGENIGLDYKRGDVIVFQKPGLNDFIKRIVAVPNDEIAIRDGYVYVNGKKVIEEYLPPSTFTKGGNFILDGAENLKVPAGKYVALGDNRGNSQDSRFAEVGFIDRSWIKGKVFLRYWPVNKFGIIESGIFKDE